MNTVQTQHLETILYDCLSRFSTVAVAPKGDADPIAHLGVSMVGINVEPNATDEPLVKTPYNGKIG